MLSVGNGPMIHYWNSPICRLPRRTANTYMVDGKVRCRLPPHGKAPVSHFFCKEVLCRLQEIDGRQTSFAVRICASRQQSGRDGESWSAGYFRPLTTGFAVY